MASEVDIGNLALAHVGDDANVASIDPPEGGPQAEHVARFYPIARDTLLEMHAWSFATITAALAPVTHPVDGWDYSFALPGDCLKPLLLYPTGARHETDEPAQFDTEIAADGQPLVLCNVQTPWLRYVTRITDTARFTPLFVDALGWLLASMLAGPVIKGDAGTAAAKGCWSVFMMRFAQASMADANKSRLRLDPKAPWINARGVNRYIWDRC